jgi:mannosyl-3-phosphoglycerate phosphatase family protein
VFTDLDGSLLDHHSYSYLDAQPQLHHLEHRGIPVIPASSKTRAEIEKLRNAMRNRDPFIAENGAAVFIPAGYFPQKPPGTVDRDGYWVHEMSIPRSRALQWLEELHARFPDEIDWFARAGTEGIVRMTNLPEADARLANRREYSEPVLWTGEAGRKAEFIASLEALGATVLQGGRFLGVGGDCDKGRALLWLREVFRVQQPDLPCHDIAIGDSGNDGAMLEAAETALLIRSSVHDFPTLKRTEGVIRSRGYGPAGWAEGVALWLQGMLQSES